MRTPNLVEIENVGVRYRSADLRLGRARNDVWAVRGVSLSIGHAETLGLVGESGSGKSTIGQCVLGNVRPTEGTIRVAGFDVGAFGTRVPLDYRWVAQVVWQDPYRSLTPGMSIGTQIGEPLARRRKRSRAEVATEVARLLEVVGLEAEMAKERPSRFSGGQRQRIAVARALAAEPRLIVLDEPVSALDVISQAQLIEMLEKVQRELGVSYLLISHDLAVVRHMAHRTAVMCRGQLVESGTSNAVAEMPTHPYTRELQDSVLDLSSTEREARSSGRAVPVARQQAHTLCPYLERCPRAIGACERDLPRLVQNPETRHLTACHHPLTSPSA
ncbi:ATP-binding cassette domain-containing protein [Nocardioides sp. LMS-CY]|uniref:Oligopeptide/dipeptide ABC transporter ATP-binding protein n=1 Tax=Nocardioides soli TaxID=1036020 RepID=A0A7W4VXG1_9ACTN|nr:MULTISPECIES: oligopeptide/dipeptide ABC transporter ATP-binding protein [Nocardioides]MBB3043470.1 oligopeptide/dipeptide ABC transporter ATP-binding protein [Nocardioides soli]QWF20994.1 ATP-binding cassette domain-containing protein [Nocardioides sp. LMS-CY]